MKYRQLGKTNLSVSEISLGCSGFWGNSNFPEKKASAVVFEAFERGVNFFDTGHNYCNFHAEPRLGRIVRELLLNRDRSSLVISSKAGATVGAARVMPVPRARQKNFSPKFVEKVCAKSIRNLNCDYLDIFQLHGPTITEITEPLLKRLSIMREQGMFRYLGVNTHSKEVMLYVAKHPEIFDMVLIDFNILQLDREPIIDELDQSGIGVVAGTVLGQGHLVKGKIGSLKTSADIWYLGRALLKRSGRVLAKRSREMREALNLISEMSASQAAFSFILENPKVASCVFGTTKIANLIEIIESGDKRLGRKSQTMIRNTFKLLQEESGM